MPRACKPAPILPSRACRWREQFDNADTSHFEMDWRVMNKDWKPQQTEQEAQDLAHVQLKNFMKIAPRRGKETAFVREPDGRRLGRHART